MAKSSAKQKPKKLIYKILKILWIILGIFILIWTGSIYLKMTSSTGLGIIAWVILFTLGIYLFFLYIGLTILFFLIRWIIRKIKEKKKGKR